MCIRDRTEQGEAEAKRGGELLKEKNVLPDIVFTSLLRRAINTANIALDAADRLWIPVQRDWRLNERHYGALQGKNKTEIREEYGDEKFMLWRRSYATPPPEIDPNDQYAQNNDPRYAGDPVPEAECLANVAERVKPYFESAIEPELKAGKTVLIAAHGNSLRAIVKMPVSYTHLDVYKRQAAACGRMPIITNSAAPRMNAPEASASRLFFMVPLITSVLLTKTVRQSIDSSDILRWSANKYGGLP